jgi:hydroxyquinol 1,2-dioxygenase
VPCTADQRKARSYRCAFASASVSKRRRLQLGSIGYVARRPAHLHFIVAADGFETITTQIFSGADPLLAEDALFNAKPDLVGEFLKEVAEDGGVRWSLDFTFVMARAAARRQQG